MNDHRLHRLLRAAATAPARPVPSTLSRATETRVLARWRAARTEDEQPFLVPWFRRGFALACGFAVVIGLVSFSQTSDGTTDLWALSNAAVNLAALP